MGPCLVDAAAAAALDLLGQVLAGVGHCLVGQGDEVEVIDCDSGTWEPHPQRFSERCRRVDRDDLPPRPPRRQASGQAKSQSPAPLWSRPSTTPRTWPVSGSTMVVIHVR